MQDAYIDLVKLANGGTIPREIPAHYVRFCWVEHRRAKGMRAPLPAWNEAAPNVIILGGRA